MTSGTYVPISFDDFTSRPYGLLSVATPVTADDHWQAGVQWEPLCAQGSSTFLPCVSGIALTPTAKSLTYDETYQGARPFTIITELDCAPVGAWVDAEPQSLQALTRVEQGLIEEAFWTGIAGGQHLVYPNLTTVGPVFDSEILLQPAGTYVSGVTAIDVVEGLGQLENALAACWDGVGVIHVPSILLPALCAQSLVYREGARLYTKAGNLVAAGAGYPWNVGPNNAVSPAGTGWLMATGPVFIIRGNAKVLDKQASLDRSVNTLKVISERTVLVGYSCCHAGVLVTLGGEPAGTVSA